MRRKTEISLPATLLLGTILLLAALPQVALGASGGGWQMKQGDMENTGRADYEVPAERMNDTFFNVFSWQKPSPNSPSQGGFGATSMVFCPGSGPAAADMVVATYHWPKGVQGMDMHDGSFFWSGNPCGGETIARITPAFSNDGTTIYVANDATSGGEYPNGHPLMAFASDVGPGTFWHNGEDPVPWHTERGSPTIAPDDLIFMHGWNDRPYAGFDDGDAIYEAWEGGTGGSFCRSEPAIFSIFGDYRVVQGTRDGDLYNMIDYDGTVMWSVSGCGYIDAPVTMEPEMGNVYVASGTDDIFVTGLDLGGNDLWSSTTLQVYDYIPGTNNPQRAQSAGCLSWDEETFYFQTNSNEGDGCLYAINTSDGSVKWTYETGSLGWEIESSSPIITLNDVIVVGNNHGDTYFALLDSGTHATLLDTYAVNSDDTDHGRAVASATLSADGLLYLPLRTIWTESNGDGDTPSFELANVYSAFDLEAEAVVMLPPPINQMAFALDNSVQLFWDEVADPDVIFDHYAVYRETVPFTDVTGLTPIVTIDNIALTEHLDDTAINGTSYWYAVTTVATGGGEMTGVSPIGPRTPFYAYDLQVVSISRTPRYPRYCAEYTVHEITEPGGFGPYYCSAATGLGCGQDENTQRWPEVGDPITYTATVRNRGTVAIYDLVEETWTVDGSTHDTDGEMLFFVPGETRTFETQLNWDGLSHELGFEMTFIDDRPENNALAIDTKSVAYFSCIERSRLENFREDTVNYPLATTDDFIDWLNLHMARMNEMFEDAGCDKRVHYDVLPVIGDLDPDPAIEQIEFAIFPLRYATDDGSLRTSGYYRAEDDIDFGLIHEWSHQLGLIDLYRLNLESWMNEVNGEAYRSGEGMMMACSDFYSEHSAHAMNGWLDVAHGYFGQYLYNLPEQVMLRITDLEGRPMRFTQVRVYQKAERPGVGEVLSNQVKFSGMTNELGEWTMPNVEIDPLLVPPCPSGDTLTDNPFGYVHVVGSNGLFLIEVEYDGIVNYTWLDIVEVNNAFWAGQTETVVIERQLEFADYMYVLPDELTELNAHQWSGHADNGYTVTLSDDTGMVMVGDGSICYDTDALFDSWMRFPGSGNARWNMESLEGFEFWVYSENGNQYGFQNMSPWIFLVCEGGSYEYHPTDELLNPHLDSWVHFSVPLEGNSDWDLIVHDSPDLSCVQSIEFHADTWGAGFILWIDGFHFELDAVAVDDSSPFPSQLALSQNAPNPFNPTTMIEFAMPEAGQLRLMVYDASGRRLRTLADGDCEAGRHSVIWDGRDDAGHEQVSGIYFYRLETRSSALTRKMLLLK